MIVEREQAAAAAREQLLRVPIRRRNHGCARAHRVGKRAARHLRLVEIGTDEDVRREQIAVQLLVGDELAAKRHVVADAELLGLALEHRSIRLAFAPNDDRMRGADDEVHDVREPANHGGQRSDHRLDAFVAAEQPEREEQPSSRHAELGLEHLPIGAASQHGNSMRNDPHFRSAHAVRAREQVSCNLAHYNELLAALPHLPHDCRLILRRTLENRVKRDHCRHAQRVDEIEKIAAIVAAENAVLVLNADQPNAAVIDEFRRPGVVGFDVLPELELDLGGVLVVSRGIGDGEHDG